jgi:ketosteroid isomerase-like protein
MAEGNFMKTSTALTVMALIVFSGVELRGRLSAATPARPPRAHNSSASDSAMERQIISSEREGLDALKTGDLQRFADLTADEAVFVDAHGSASKAQVLQNVAGFTLKVYSMEDVKFVPISPNSGLISYKASETGVSHGKEFTVQVYVSSIWTERGTKWVCLFSQETAARTTPPPQSHPTSTSP